MMDRKSIASLVTIGGITLAVMQMMKRKNRPTGLKAMLHWMSNMTSRVSRNRYRLMHNGQQMLNNSAHALQGLRKRVKM